MEKQEQGLGRLRDPGLGLSCPPSLSPNREPEQWVHTKRWGGQGAQGGPRSGPPSPSLAAAVSLSPPAAGAAFGGVGNLVGLVMGALSLPGAHQGVLLISEPTQGSIPMDHPLVWPSLITP